MISKTLLDRIFSELAQPIVDGIGNASGENANFIGPGGVIIASGDSARIGTVHEGGKRIMDGECDEVAITEEMATALHGSRPGYNGVVVYNGQRIAVIGISGDPELVKPVQRMAAIAVKYEIQRFIEMNQERSIVDRMKAEIREVAAQMQVISINGSIQAAKLGEKGNAFKIIVTEMRRLADQIKQITDKNYRAER